MLKRQPRRGLTLLVLPCKASRHLELAKMVSLVILKATKTILV